MSGLIKRIEQEISDLEAAIANVAIKMQNLQQQYVQVIANASAHQIILATYQLCTKDYPSHFLGLSLDARQRLQNEVQVVASSFSQNIISTSEDLAAENLDIPENSDLKDSSDNPNIAPSPSDSPIPLEAEIDSDTLEKLVSQSLIEVVKSIHQLLANHGLLSLPLAEDAPSIQLRLLDVELSDRQALLIRGEIRVLGARLQQLHSEFEKKQKAKLVAQAELAWRSTWVEIKQSS